MLNVEFITGNLGNGFIALVNIMDWVKRRKISSVDQILTALAISRITVLWSLLIVLFYIWVVSSLMITGKVERRINIFWMVTNHVSFWLAINISIIYFLKMAIFSPKLYVSSPKVESSKFVLMTLLEPLLLLSLNILVINTHDHVWIDEHKPNIFYLVISIHSGQL